jgi:penicillin-binding protein 2
MLIFDQLKKSDPHLQALAVTVFAGIFLLLSGLWWVQVVSARHYEESLETQSYRTIRVPAARGRILDRNGNVLADNQPRYDVNLYLEDLSDRFRDEYSQLRPLQITTNSPPLWKRWFGASSITTQRVRLQKSQIEALEWRARYDVASAVVHKVSADLQTPLTLDFQDFTNHYGTRRAMPYPVAEDLNSTQLARFEERSTDLPSVDLEIEARRVYPYQTTAAHVLGHLIRDDRSMVGEEAYFSYRLPDYRGVVGIEAGYDSVLHGRAGEESVLVNNLGYRQTENVWTPVEPGSNVVLTIDLHVQQAAEEALRRLGPFGPETRGAAVVLDVHTGDILAMASSPTYNPNAFIPSLSLTDSRQLSDPKLRPEINRATQENYAPGSTFKTIVGLACLEAGLDPNATIYNPGFIYVGRSHRPIRDLAPPGDYDFQHAIMYSSNTYFITNGLKAGIENIVKLARRAHLGERTGLPTRQETAGIFPTLQQVRSGWTAGDTANICIGQGAMAVTPLQMAVLTAALANGGTVLWPRLVDRIESQDPASDAPPIVFPKGRVRDHLGVSQRSLGVLRNAMRAEVEQGTGREAEVPGLSPCGKTGTAQVMNERNQTIDHTTWFISYAPYEAPRYAVVVMIQSGISGGRSCAPIAKPIYEALLQREQKAASGGHALVRSN